MKKTNKSKKIVGIIICLAAIGAIIGPSSLNTNETDDKPLPIYTTIRVGDNYVKETFYLSQYLDIGKNYTFSWDNYDMYHEGYYGYIMGGGNGAIQYIEITNRSITFSVIDIGEDVVFWIKLQSYTYYDSYSFTIELYEI